MYIVFEFYERHLVFGSWLNTLSALLSVYMVVCIYFTKNLFTHKLIILYIYFICLNFSLGEH